MIRIFFSFGVCSLLGALLAVWPGDWPIRAGLIGLLVMVVAAYLVRLRWSRNNVSSPDSPERSLWLSMASSATVAAHLIVSLLRIGPEFRLHSEAGHRLGLDSWTLVLGLAIAYLIARDPRPRFDERDRLIAFQGTRWALGLLTGLLLLFALALSFEVIPQVSLFSHAMIAHVLIALVIVTALAGYVVQLYIYSRDHVAEDGGT